MDGITRRALRQAGVLLGAIATVAAVVYLVRVTDLDALATAARAVTADPVRLAGALLGYAAAFVLRSIAWRRVLPRLDLGQAWAALHVSLLGNHVLPLRLGEALRVTSVLRRTSVPAAATVGSAVVLRSADVLAVVALALVAAPTLVTAAGGAWTWPLLALGCVVLACGLGALVVLRRRGAAIRLPGVLVAVLATAAWLLEAVVVHQVAHLAGVTLSFPDAVAVTAVTIAAQALAVTPGGFGTYEAAAAAAMTATGVDPAQAVAVAFLTHAVKTAYSLVVGLVAVAVPAPTYFGRWRLPRTLPPRPPAAQVSADAPVVALIPVHDEAATIGEVVRGRPARVGGREVLTLVVDDGSTDGSGACAAAAGAEVVRQHHLGLGAAVRHGLAAAVRRDPAAVVYLDGDLEYDPADFAAVAEPVLNGTADYVVGSRFAGDIRSMRPHRRLGNRLLTRWVRWMTRRSDLTDGQSGFRAFSATAAADAEVVHDYNYAQVLTLDLLGKGFTYSEVPIGYAFRRTGTSFVRLGRYLRAVLPAVHRELNAVSPPSAAAESWWRRSGGPGGAVRVDQHERLPRTDGDHRHSGGGVVRVLGHDLVQAPTVGVEDEGRA